MFEGSYKVGRNDILLIIFLLAAGFLSMFTVSTLNKENVSSVAVVSIDSREAYRIPLDGSQIEERVKIKFKNHTGYIDIKNGSVRMEEMDSAICPEKICSETGWIEKSYQTIVCLPNKIVVRIENDRKDAPSEFAVDGVSF